VWTRKRKKKCSISARGQNDKLKIKGMVNPLGSFDPEGSLPQDLSASFIPFPDHYKKG